MPHRIVCHMVLDGERIIRPGGVRERGGVRHRYQRIVGRARHLQRLEDQALHETVEGLACGHLGDVARQLEAVVAVGIHRSWRSNKATRDERLVHRARQPVVVARAEIGRRTLQSRGVAQQQTQGDGPLGCGLAEAQVRHIVADRAIEVERPSLHQAQDHGPGEWFRGGPNVEERAWGDRHAPFLKAGHAKAVGIDHILALYHGNGKPRHPPHPHTLGNAFLQASHIEHDTPPWIPCRRPISLSYPPWAADRSTPQGALSIVTCTCSA